MQPKGKVSPIRKWAQSLNEAIDILNLDMEGLKDISGNSKTDQIELLVHARALSNKIDKIADAARGEVKKLLEESDPEVFERLQKSDRETLMAMILEADAKAIEVAQVDGEAHTATAVVVPQVTPDPKLVFKRLGATDFFKVVSVSNEALKAFVSKADVLRLSKIGHYIKVTTKER